MRYRRRPPRRSGFPGSPSTTCVGQRHGLGHRRGRSQDGPDPPRSFGSRLTLAVYAQATSAADRDAADHVAALFQAKPAAAEEGGLEEGEPATEPTTAPATAARRHGQGQPQAGRRVNAIEWAWMVDVAAERASTRVCASTTLRITNSFAAVIPRRRGLRRSARTPGEQRQESRDGWSRVTDRRSPPSQPQGRPRSREASPYDDAIMGGGFQTSCGLQEDVGSGLAVANLPSQDDGVKLSQDT